LPGKIVLVLKQKHSIRHFKLEGELTMLRFVLPMPGLGAVNGSPFLKAKRAAQSAELEVLW